MRPRVSDVADLFRRLSAGVYVIGVADDGRRNAFTAAWLMQVSFDPLLLALSVNPEHASYPLLVGGGGFTVSVLSRDQVDLARHFGTVSARDGDKLAGIAWRSGPTGAPILEGRSLGSSAGSPVGTKRVITRSCWPVP